MTKYTDVSSKNDKHVLTTQNRKSFTTNSQYIDIVIFMYHS